MTQVTPRLLSIRLFLKIQILPHLRRDSAGSLRHNSMRCALTSKLMLDAGVIRPSNSPWCNAVVLVRKKDGSLRFCIDFRRLNSLTVQDSHPLPRICETLESLAGAAHYTTIDMNLGFWQVPMDDESKQYTTFTLGSMGLYECESMPFGLCNAPPTFQRLMLNCLGELNLTYCLIYLDDVIIFSKTEEEHLERMRVVFD